MSKKILIADDDEKWAQLLADMLKEKGFSVDVACDPIQAIAQAKRTKPDLILLDMRMPAGGGIRALQAIRMHADTSHVPIVLMSGSLDPIMPDMSKKAGADLYLHKPLSAQDFAQTIQERTKPFFDIDVERSLLQATDTDNSP